MKPTPLDAFYTVEEFDYQLLDTGNCKKLERFGPYTFVRPAPQVIWPPNLSKTDWLSANGEFCHHKGKSTGGGEWPFRNPVPKNGWPLRFQDLVFTVQPTPFGHLGLYKKEWPLTEFEQRIAFDRILTKSYEHKIKYIKIILTYFKSMKIC